VLTINPLHRQTLLLLHHCYSRTKKYDQAFQCVLDLYIMAKEIKDTHIQYYEKRIRTTSRKMDHFTPEKKTKLLKERIKALKTCLDGLEEKHPEFTKNKLLGEKATYADQLRDEPTVIASSEQYEEEWNAHTLQAFEDEDEEAINEDTDPRLNQLLEASMEGYVIDDKTQLDSAPTDVPRPIAKNTSSDHPLRQVPFLRKMDEANLKKIENFTSFLQFESGDWIFQEKDPVFGFFILLEGQVQLIKSNQTLSHQEAVANLDEDDFFRVDQRSFGAQCTEDCQALFFNKAGYQNLFQRQPEDVIAILWYFAQSITNKIHLSIEQLEALSLPPSSQEEFLQNKERSNLRTLNQSEIQVLSTLFTPKQLKKNDILYANGQSMDTCYVVLEGQVTLSHPKQNPILVQRHELFAELTLSGPNYFHGFDAHISSPEAQVISITRKQLSKLDQFEVTEQRFLADLLIRILSNKNKELRDFLYKTLYLKKRG
jgi:CRP-like cAMP-binding protein